jgi:hypothetical protein
VAKVDLNKISSEDGTIDELKYDEIPIIMFRKSLVTEPSPNALPSDIQSANKDKERTVFVVNSKYLIDDLKNLSVRPNVATFPWEQINQ